MKKPSIPEIKARPIPEARVVPSVAAKVLPPIKRRPELIHFKAAPDPIDESKHPGDPEGDVKEELSQLHSAFRERAKEEASRFKSATDANYYFVVAFEDGAQKAAILEHLGLSEHISSGLFIDGRAMADRLGVKLPESRLKLSVPDKVDKKLSPLVMKTLRG